MDVVVCVKQIPDPADPGELDPGTKTLKRDTKLILDESDSYGVKALAREITSLSKKLREKNFSLEDVSGSTFTISNNGSFNSFLTFP